MIQSPRRRLVGAAAALMLLGATLLSTAGIAVGSGPAGWSMTVTSLPLSVTPGADAGYQVTIYNIGPSNISQLFLVNDFVHKGNPTYVGTPSQGTCTLFPGVQLKCSFGALNAGTSSAPNSVTVTVGFATFGTGTFDPGLEANTSGVSFTDPTKSHGDALVDPTFVATNLSTDKNFGGGFITPHGQIVSDFAKLNGNNKQNTAVTGLPLGTPATVQDGPNNNPWTCIDEPANDIVCSQLSTEWSSVNAGNGGRYDTGAIIVQISFNSGTPGWFLHVRNGVQERINQCLGNVYDGSVTPCFTWDNSTKTASIHTFFNGPYRG
jgi:hypothetical protein